MDLREALGVLTGEDGLSVALIAGRDGLMLEGLVTAGTSSPAQLAALAASSLMELERIGHALGVTPPTQIRLQFERSELLIEPLTDIDILVAGIAGSDGGDRLAEAVARRRGAILKALSDF